jgi:release factor glutamine methyltransferase
MDPSGSITDLLRRSAGRLRGIDAGNPYLEAEYLMEQALGWERVRLLAQKDLPAPPDGAARFEVLLLRRLAREPLQYILGHVPFCEIDLAVGPGVLIPRSETEILVERVAQAASSLAGSLLPAGRAPLLVDLGTGSGAILLALLHRLPGWRGLGVDRSRDALSWARRNREGVTGRGRGKMPAPAADLMRGDWAGAIRPRSAQVVVSNPPYIRRQEMASLAPEIRDHEPGVALDGGVDGLAALNRVCLEAAPVLTAGGILALECAPDQAETLAREVEAGGAYRDAVIFFDLAGRARGLLARRSETEGTEGSA